MLGIKTTLTRGSYRVFIRALRNIGFRNARPAEGVLVFKTDRIGDFILATGAMHLICRHFGEKQVTLMVSSLLEPLVRNEFPNCCVIAVPKVQDRMRSVFRDGWLPVRKVYGARRYQRLINLRHHPNLFEDVLLSSIKADDSLGAISPLGSAYWMTQMRAYRPRRSFAYPPATSTPNTCLELEAHRILMRELLGREVSLAEIMPRWTLPVNGDAGHFIIVPFASEKIKNYPPEHLAEAVVLAGLPPTIPLVICGEAAVAAALDQFAALIRPRLPNPVRVVSNVGLLEFVKMVAGACGVISMDSAAAHIATALDRKGVFILGGGHYGVFAPWARSERQQWLNVPLPCYGCNWNCNQPYIRCIQDVTPASVAQALRQVWNQT